MSSIFPLEWFVRSMLVEHFPVLCMSNPELPYLHLFAYAFQRFVPPFFQANILHFHHMSVPVSHRFGPLRRAPPTLGPSLRTRSRPCLPRWCRVQPLRGRVQRLFFQDSSVRTLCSVEAIASRLEAIALRLEAIAASVEAIASGLEAIVSRE